MRIVAIIALCLALSSCVTERTHFVYTTYEVPKEYLTCEKIRKSDFPDVSKMTDKDVASLLRDLWTKLQKCNLNVGSAREFIDKANRLAVQKNSESIKK